MIITCFISELGFSALLNRYEDYVDEFKRIFPTHKSVPNYFVPGNTDLGCVLGFII
jgi:hypothetical protein